jgi:hypothetical protein
MTRYVIGLALCVLLANPLRAEESAAPASGNEESNSDLAKKTQNPVADLISVPFQNNFNFNTGPEKRSVWDLNIQPVVPIKLTDDWNLITRTIVPIINQPPLVPGVDQATGLGDINPSFFLSPSGSKGRRRASAIVDDRSLGQQGADLDVKARIEQQQLADAPGSLRASTSTSILAASCSRVSSADGHSAGRPSPSPAASRATTRSSTTSRSPGVAGSPMRPGTSRSTRNSA